MCVRRYAQSGAHVAILARRKARLEVVAEKARALGAASVHVIDADVKDEAGCQSAMERTLAAFGGELDILVLNHVIGFWGTSSVQHLFFCRLAESR